MIIIRELKKEWVSLVHIPNIKKTPWGLKSEQGGLSWSLKIAKIRSWIIGSSKFLHSVLICFRKFHSAELLHGTCWVTP